MTLANTWQKELNGGRDVFDSQINQMHNYSKESMQAEASWEQEYESPWTHRSRSGSREMGYYHIAVFPLTPCIFSLGILNLGWQYLTQGMSFSFLVNPLWKNSSQTHPTLYLINNLCPVNQMRLTIKIDHYIYIKTLDSITLRCM